MSNDKKKRYFVDLQSIDETEELYNQLINSLNYNPSNEPSDADTIRSWSIDSRGSSDDWYISDDGFVSFTPTPELLYLSKQASKESSVASVASVEPPKKRRRKINVLNSSNSSNSSNVSNAASNTTTTKCKKQSKE